MEHLQNTIRIMESYNHLGTKTLEIGTRLIGHVPHVAPEAWLHIIFAPLTLSDIRRIEAEIETSLPDVFSFFLLLCNGLSLFSGNLDIYGLRKSFVRTGDAAWQPFSITTVNTIERPRKAKPSFVFIGGYSNDGSLLYIDKDDLQVYRCKQRSTKPLNQWANFETMLEEEAKRLTLLFDDMGRKLTTNQPTTP